MTKAEMLDYVAEVIGVDAREISYSTRLVDDLGVDSLRILELVGALEEKLDDEIPDEDLSKILSVQSLIDYLSSRGIELADE